jgi:predicted DNA-binding protein (MmcQ/YjbR family)
MECASLELRWGLIGMTAANKVGAHAIPWQGGGSMTPARFNSFCRSLLHATYVVQWGGAHVWKVGGKVFAIAWEEEPGLVHVTFKCSPMSYDILKRQDGLRPAPYLASRGMLWIQRMSDASMDDAALQDYLRESHRLASLNLSKKIQKNLGLNEFSGLHRQ